MLIKLDLEELERELGGEVQDFLLELSNEIVNLMQVEAPVGATGDLQRSIQIFRTDEGVIWLGTRIHYAEDVWQGTEPHIVEDFQGLQVWARRKLGDESLAYPVFQKIAREGTDANPFVERAIDQAIERVA